MRSVESLFQEQRFEVLQVLSRGEEGTNFEEILGNVAKVVGRTKEDLDTGHGLVNAVYDLLELNLVKKSGPDTYILVNRGKRVLQVMSCLEEMERRSLYEPFAIQMIKLLAPIQRMSIYRLQSRLTSSDKEIEAVVEQLKDRGLVTTKESPMDTHRLVELTTRGEEAVRVIEQLEEELRSLETRQRKLRIL